MYTGTIAAVVIVVLWVYYAALIFVLGGEVAQVHELRRIRRMQREQLESLASPRGKHTAFAGHEACRVTRLTSKSASVVAPRLPWIGPRDRQLEAFMRKASLVAAVAIISIAGACKKTGEGEYQVKTPDVDVSTDTSTVQTPTVETGTRKDTVITTVPTVDVKTPAERRADSAAARQP